MHESTAQTSVGVAVEEAVDLLSQMVRVRRFEEACAELYGATKIRGFLHLAVGEEGANVGAVGALTHEDAIVATYREHAHALVRGIPMEVLMAEMFGKREGTSRGRGGSMHVFDVTRRFYGGNAIVAGGLPLAAGLALADHLRGERRITACFFGDGAVAEGEFHETMNLAALWKLPVLFVCENNRYAMGTAIERALAQTDIAILAGGYGIPAEAVDGMDVVACRRATESAAAAVREEGTPRFLELRTFRFRGHSMYDPDRYRSKDEIDHWRERDPIDALVARVPGLAAHVATIEATAAAEVAAAISYAEAGTWEPVADLTRFVMTEREDR